MCAYLSSNLKLKIETIDILKHNQYKHITTHEFKPMGKQIIQLKYSVMTFLAETNCLMY